MTSPFDNLTGVRTTTANAVPTPPPARTLDREAFLKLLVAQVRQQDPLKPMEGTEFVTQLAQFSVVEQSIQQSRQLEGVDAQLRGISNNAATDLVGRTVTVRGNSLYFDGAQDVSVNATLESAATQVSVSIRDAGGSVVRSVNLPARSAGAFSWTWDGRDDRGNRVAAGSYAVTVSGRSAQGSAVSATQDVTGQVRRVGYDRGYPELELEGGARAPISQLVSVSARAGTSTTANSTTANSTTPSASRSGTGTANNR